MFVSNKVARCFSARKLMSVVNPPIQERLSVQAVRESAELHLKSTRFYSNFLIGKDYLATVMQYSKCYLCKLPLAKQFVRRQQGMENIDKHIRKLNEALLAELPQQLRLLRWMGRALHYADRNLHSALGFVLGENKASEAQVKYLAAIEAVTLGFEMHNSVGGRFVPNPVVRLALWAFRKVVKDKYLVLAGDYMHIRGSVLASETGSVELPHLLSDAEVALCKQVHLREQLQNKIAKEGYEAVTVKDTYEISRMRAALTVSALRGVASQGIQSTAEQEQIWENIGLLVLYRRQLQEFMFNFPRLLHRFVSIKTGNALFWQEHTLTQYLFFQSAQRTGLRLDLAYLNTVQLLRDQISLLQRKLESSLGEAAYSNFTRRLSYILMMYS